jgi:signal transduction histidine kinase
MNSSFSQQHSSPIQLLLRLEWVLLAVAAIVQMLVIVANHHLGLPLFNILGLIVFAAMGLSFPDRWSDKLLYTAVEFGILLALTFGGEFPSPSLLYVVLTIRNCVLLAGNNPTQGQVRSAITLLAVIVCLLSQTYRLWSGRMPLSIPFAQIGSVWIGLTIVIGLVFLFLHLLVDAILAERKGQEQLAAANTQLRQYALRVEELATVQERNRIARDIHDSLGHSLTVFNIHVGAALRLIHTDTAEAEALLLEVKQLGSQALQEVRESVTLLRADPFQGRSLEETIASLVKEFGRTTGIIPTFTYGITQPLTTELNFTLYRLIQESLTNISKHGVATEVSIELQQTAAEITAIVQDNGRGFDLHRHPSGFGLQGMQERTSALGGSLKIITAPNRGCRIQVTFPDRS